MTFIFESLCIVSEEHGFWNKWIFWQSLGVHVLRLTCCVIVGKSQNLLRVSHLENGDTKRPHFLAVKPSAGSYQRITG